MDVAGTGEIPEGSAKAVAVLGHDLLVARVGDSYYVAQDLCPHMGARLSEGRLDGTIVICPRHGSRFDLKDGRVLRWTDLPRPVAAIAKVVKSPRPLRTYPVKLLGDRVLVQL